MRFFSSGNSGLNKLRIHATNKLKKEVNKINKAFLSNVRLCTWNFSKKQNKNTFGYWKPLRGNTNLEKSIYDFLLTQQNKTKNLLDFEINFIGDFDSYINEIINSITEDSDDLLTHSAAKFLFYYFNNLMHDLNEDTYKIRHTLISENK